MVGCVLNFEYPPVPDRGPSLGIQTHVQELLDIQDTHRHWTLRYFYA